MGNEMNNDSNTQRNDEEEIRKQRAILRQQRTDKKKRRKRKRWILKTVLFIFVLAALIVALLLAGSMTQDGHLAMNLNEFNVSQLIGELTGKRTKTQETTGIREITAISGAEDAEDEATEAAPASTSEASVTPDPTEAPTASATEPAVQTTAQTADRSWDTGEIDLAAATDAPKTVDEAIASARAFAVQYDYDRAIKVLQSNKEFAQDARVPAAIEAFTADKAACVAVDVTTVPHVFFHSLLNDDRGFQASIVGELRAVKNNAAMTSTEEFDAMLLDMYNAGYVLVSLDDLIIKEKNADGSTTVTKNTELMLPAGKKALIMSEDDLSYYHSYGIGSQGYATRMVLDENGMVKCEYTDENGETKIGDYDMVPRLDTFVREHPDFSYHGHKATVALTGYNGVFGYRTNDYYKDINNPHLDPDQVQWLKDHPDFDWNADVKAATEIADAMKANGWTFASHTYAHWNASNKTAEQLQADNERWKTCVENIVGFTDKIIFAFGGDIGGVGEYTDANAKFKYFKDQGYVIFCNVDGHAGWTDFGTNYMRTGRVPLDGFAMYQAMTPEGGSHGTYGKSFEILGINDVASFFNKYRITPIESE